MSADTVIAQTSTAATPAAAPEPDTAAPVLVRLAALGGRALPLGRPART